MAPSVSLADQVEKLAAIVAGMHAVTGLGRDLRRAAALEPSQVAAVCGVTAAELTSWENGMACPATGQALAWLGPLHERAMARAVSYAAQIRQGRSRLGYIAETSQAEADAALAKLREDFPRWVFPQPDGWSSLGGEKPRLVWSAKADPGKLADKFRHDGGWPQVYGGSSGELASNLAAVEAFLQSERKRMARWLGVDA
jgi:hypothetical protein